MKYWLGVCVIGVALGCLGCDLFTGPSEDLTGSWSATYSKFVFLGVDLEQRGDTITGTACHSSSGVVIFSGVPVSGNSPRFEFTVRAEHVGSCCAHFIGRRYVGYLDAEDRISGLTEIASLTRTNGPVCR